MAYNKIFDGLSIVHFVLNYINPADHDCWDGLIFGYPDFNYDFGHVFKKPKLCGIILLENGNHKLLFKIPHKRGFDKALYRKQVSEFMTNYKNQWNIKLDYVPLALHF